MDQTNTHNTNQQSTEQQRSYPQKNQEENDQATILVPYTQERDDTTIEDQIFYSKVPIKPTGHSKGYPKIINLLSKPMTKRQVNLLR